MRQPATDDVLLEIPCASCGGTAKRRWFISPTQVVLTVDRVPSTAIAFYGDRPVDVDIGHNLVLTDNAIEAEGPLTGKVHHLYHYPGGRGFGD